MDVDEVIEAYLEQAFADLGVDPGRVREVAAFIPGAMRGITSERQLGTYIDLDVARQLAAGLAAAHAAEGVAGQGAGSGVLPGHHHPGVQSARQ